MPVGAQLPAQGRKRRPAAPILAILRQQREDLAACLDRLIDALRDGRAQVRRYRQFKMYNDPTLNPALVAEASQVRR